MHRVLMLAFAFSLAAQDSRFETRSRLVLVPVNVTDTRGHSINALGAEDFLLFDDGRRRQPIVDTIDTGVAPVALIVAVQSAGISAAVVEKVQRIGVMIQPLVTGERGCGGLVSFDQKIAWRQECTNDPYAISTAFRGLRPLLRPGEDHEAHMLDAVQQAIERLTKKPNSRRVLLLISESRDRGSENALDRVMLAAQAADVTVYAATYSAFKEAFTSKAPVSRPRRPLKPEMPNDHWGSTNPNPPGKNNPWPKIPPPEQQIDVLGGIGEWKRLQQANAAEALTKATGGATFPFTKQKALEEAIARLGAELHNQYVLSFVPDAAPPGYRTLEVRLNRPGEFRIRARPGYWVK